jgi:RHS repeat-associated protein
MQDGVLTATYLYDANGNRTSVTTASGTQAATYDAQDRLLTYGNWSYTYTANGDLQTKTDTSNGQVTNYVYDAQGNLRHVGLPDGRSIDYLVDAENRRVAKKINGTLVKKWLYKSQLTPVAEFDGSGMLVARYIDGVTVKGSTSYRMVADHLGTPRLLVNATTGAVAQRLDLDEWGQVAADSNAGFQVFGFAGGIYDPDTGLVRFGARDYDPVVGRWTAKDPILFEGSESSLYRYVGANPINHVDREGKQGAEALQSFGPIGKALSMAILAGIAVYELCKAQAEPAPRRPTDDCDAMFTMCLSSDLAFQRTTYGHNMCFNCRDKCVAQGFWPATDWNGRSCAF